MNNPIPYSSLFVTPDSVQALDEMIRKLGTDSERALAYQYTMYAFNLCHRLLEQSNGVGENSK